MEPDLNHGSWRMYTKDHDEADAARLFRQRYGCEPEYIVEDGAYLYVGPIPERQTRDVAVMRESTPQVRLSA